MWGVRTSIARETPAGAIDRVCDQFCTQLVALEILLAKDIRRMAKMTRIRPQSVASCALDHSVDHAVQGEQIQNRLPDDVINVPSNADLSSQRVRTLTGFSVGETQENSV